MSISNINNTLQSMRMMEANAKNTIDIAPKPIDNGVAEFGSILNNFVNDVNRVKIDSENLQDRYVKGDPSVSLPQVMIATEKANVQLSFLTEVRNKLMDAYNDISRMGI
jgi:flagellar hook-basal body complex protein FliE